MPETTKNTPLPKAGSANKALPNRQKRDHLEWMATLRFIEEVHRLEQEGRVLSRQQLEARLLLQYGAVTMMRAGKLKVSTAAIELLKREYNGDFKYILLGVRDEELSSWWRAGKDLRRYPAYEYPYRLPAADLKSLAGLEVRSAREVESGTSEEAPPQPA